MKKIRILHVVTSMNRGGLEVWLMHVLRNIDRSQFDVDFLVQTEHPALFDAEIVERGSRVIRCPRASSPFKFARAYLKALRTHGPYDVVHTHLHHFSGVIALYSRFAGVPVVVAHSHNATYGDRAALSRKLRAYLRFTEWLLAKCADYGIGCSKRAGVDLFQDAFSDTANHGVLYCGLDFSSFANPTGAAAALPADFAGRKIIVHVGRFTKQKNHTFLVDILAELAKRRDDFRVLLVGTGDLQPSIAEKVKRCGLADRVVFAGDRNDVDRILAASDVFLFPSLNEGLPLAMLEAQAAGLRCLISDAITDEVVVNSGEIRVLPLADGAEKWAGALNDLLSQPAADRARALATMQASPFSVAASVRSLADLYRRLLAPKAAGASQ